MNIKRLLTAIMLDHWHTTKTFFSRLQRHPQIKIMRRSLQVLITGNFKPNQNQKIQIPLQKKIDLGITFETKQINPNVVDRLTVALLPRIDVPVDFKILDLFSSSSQCEQHTNINIASRSFHSKPHSHFKKQQHAFVKTAV